MQAINVTVTVLSARKVLGKGPLGTTLGSNTIWGLWFHVWGKRGAHNCREAGRSEEGATGGERVWEGSQRGLGG